MNEQRETYKDKGSHIPFGTREDGSWTLKQRLAEMETRIREVEFRCAAGDASLSSRLSALEIPSNSLGSERNILKQRPQEDASRPIATSDPYYYNAFWTGTKSY